MQYAIRKQLSNNEREKLSKYSNVLAHLLFHRGIKDADTADRFVLPVYERDIHDPLRLKDAEKSAVRIIQAIKNEERIAIYSDYDADGIPGAVIFHDFFTRIGYNNFSIYIPHRHDEGFGLNVEAVEQLAGEGVKLLITVDCGISDVKAVVRANKLGVNVIITDHHEPPAELPPAFAIVDHKQVDCKYPDKNLCGSAVAYKLIQAILAKDRLGLKEGHEKWLLDMVGIATLSDMVPLTGENRVFAYYGMSVLQKSKRKGLKELLRKLKINQKFLTEDDIGFMITPRINAASRMGVPMDAFKLLSATTDEDAKTFADHLDSINNERKGVVASLVKEVKKIIKERYGNVLPSAIVLGNPLWRPSLLGLVANTCAEEFDRPVFLWGRDGDDVIKGSCRSEGRSNIVEIMRGVPENIFLQMGGHKHSGGFAVGNDEIHFLDKHLNDSCEKIKNDKTVKQDGVGEDNFVDMEITLDFVNWNMYDDIAKLAPFGKENPKPLFLFRNIVPVSIRKFGKKGDHVEIIFKKQNGDKIPAISFFGGSDDWMEKIEPNKAIDLIATLEKSMFMNKVELRLRVVEVIV